MLANSLAGPDSAGGHLNHSESAVSSRRLFQARAYLFLPLLLPHPLTATQLSHKILHNHKQKCCLAWQLSVSVSVCVCFYELRCAELSWARFTAMQVIIRMEMQKCTSSAAAWTFAESANCTENILPSRKKTVCTSNLQSPTCRYSWPN